MALIARPLTTPARVPANCLITDSVNDLVGISGPTVMGVYQVEKANVGALAEMPAIGVIIDKPTATTCIVQLFGEVKGIYTSLVPGAVYFVGTNSKPSAVPPTPTLMKPRVYLQPIGVALDTNVLMLQPGPAMSIRVL